MIQKQQYQDAHQMLCKLWEKWRRNHAFPVFDGTYVELRSIAAEIVFWEADVAGCISRVVQGEIPPEQCRALLRIDTMINSKLEMLSGEEAAAVLSYKQQLDELVRSTVRLMKMHNSQ